MAPLNLMSEFLIVLVAATVVAVVFDRFRLPAVMGFLLAGAVIGPHGLGILSDVAHIHELAEVGMIFLMLTIGLEFSFDRIKGLGKICFIGGSAQLGLTIGLSILLSRFLDWTPYQGFVLGSVIALSSTAVVLKYLIDRGETDSIHGKIAVAILVFQDLAVVPLLVFITAFGTPGNPIGATLLTASLKTLALVTAAVIFSRYILKPLLGWIAEGRNREIFLLSAFILCFGSAWISSTLGLTTAIGAFFAGLMLANTDYAHQITGEVAPFRHIFISFFFVSIGLLFDFGFVFQNLGAVAFVTITVLVLNTLLVSLIAMAFGFSPRVAVTTGVILAQIGEFSFLILESAYGLNLVPKPFYQTLLSSAVLSIFVTPLLFFAVPGIIRLCEFIPIFGMPPKLIKGHVDSPEKLHDHVILCGLGVAGADIARALRDESVPFLIIEMNPANIKLARSEKMDVLYGDAANREVLHHAGIERAKVFVISFGDHTGITEIIRLVENMNPDITLVTRTRFEKNVGKLYELGADIVVTEELEMSLELTKVVMKNLGLSQEKTNEQLKKIRARKELQVERAILRIVDDPRGLK